MKVSRDFAYALQAVVALAANDSGIPVPCSLLAQHGAMPRRFLLQILRNLVTRGVLRSSTGASGGYELSRPPNEITLLQLVDALDNPLNPELSSWPTADSELFGYLQSEFTMAAAAGRERLQRITLADLAQIKFKQAV